VVLEGRQSGRLVLVHVPTPRLALEAVELECFEDKPDRLPAELAVHGLDVVLTDAPGPSTVSASGSAPSARSAGFTTPR
jgi:hypothetical protein